MEPTDQELEAARMFGEQLPLFKELAQKLSKKQIIRVMTSLVEYPLQKGPVKFKNPEEEVLFKSGLILLDSKLTMFAAVARSKHVESLKKPEGEQDGKMA